MSHRLRHMARELLSRAVRSGHPGEMCSCKVQRLLRVISLAHEQWRDRKYSRGEGLDAMKTYAEHYIECKKAFKDSHPHNESQFDVYALKIHQYQPNEASQLLSFPENYLDIIASLSNEADKKVRDVSEHYIEEGGISNKFAIKIANIWDLSELEQLASHFIPHLEQAMFHCYAFVSAVHIYRNMRTEDERASSWLWHYDNNPKEAIKLLIYLTDCTETTGPFEYLRHTETGEAIKLPTSRTGYDHWDPPFYPHSRIPAAVMKDFLAQGYEKCKVVGPKGTSILFDNNCVHTANIPLEGHRDVVIFNIRPVNTPIRPYITRDYTGSWMHKDPVRDPEQIRPVLQ